MDGKEVFSPFYCLSSSFHIAPKKPCLLPDQLWNSRWCCFHSCLALLSSLDSLDRAASVSQTWINICLWCFPLQRPHLKFSEWFFFFFLNAFHWASDEKVFAPNYNFFQKLGTRFIFMQQLSLQISLHLPPLTASFHPKLIKVMKQLLFLLRMCLGQRNRGLFHINSSILIINLIHASVSDFIIWKSFKAPSYGG